MAASNSMGRLFRLTTYGESHGDFMGGIIDGCPAGLEIDKAYIQQELDRRRPGQSLLTTTRKEEDKVHFHSGIYNGVSTGTPIGFIIKNSNKKQKDYDHISDAYRPSHADFTYDKKYNLRDPYGGGRSSARETANWVVGGAIAKLILKKYKIKIQAFVSEIGKISLNIPCEKLDFNLIEASPVRCPNVEISDRMTEYLKEIRKEGDSVGGKITCFVQDVPIGLGEPVFEKLQANLAKAVMSINAVKGFEYGSGFNSIRMKGSVHNDIIESRDDQIRTKSNYSGGIQGGISNGENIYFGVAFKPIPTILQDQESVNRKGEKIIIKGKGRHDICPVPRAVPIVEAMTALVLVDHFLLNKTSKL